MRPYRFREKIQIVGMLLLIAATWYALYGRVLDPAAIPFVYQEF